MDDERIEVSRVLDTRPRIFSLPVGIIIPALFIISIIGGIAYALGFSGFMILVTVVTILAVYYFLFGQEWWRLIVKFYKPPLWIRSDVVYRAFTLEPRYESIPPRKKSKRSRGKKRKRAD